MVKNSPALQSSATQSNLESLEAHRFASEADATNTQRAYHSDWNQFLSWCKRHSKAPLPASADDVAVYIRYCAEKLKLKISTVARRLCAISEAHNRSKLQSPCGEWVVRNTLKRLRRELGSPAQGKSPILIGNLRAMVSHCPPTLAGLRDKAILLIGFAGAFRRSELVNLDFRDITVCDDGIVAMIREGKTDQKREGRKVAIPYGQDPHTCPVNALMAYLEASGITEGPVFRGLTKNGKVRTTRLSDHIVALIVKKYCKLSGKKIALFSGHSLRAGLATAAAIAGASEASIQKQTGHKSLLVLRRYIRDASMFRENAARKVGL